jgi:hypothetical protein
MQMNSNNKSVANEALHWIGVKLPTPPSEL